MICYISNFSYLSDASFVVMRQRLLSEFDRIWVDCMNGDSRETGKRTPDGKPDPSVFSTESNRAGIRLGTAIGLLVRGGASTEHSQVCYRDFWGVDKRRDLLPSLEDGGEAYVAASPQPANRYSFRPSTASSAYLAWPSIIDFAGQEPISGLQEMRKGALIDIDKSALQGACPRTSTPLGTGTRRDRCIAARPRTPDGSTPRIVGVVSSRSPSSRRRSGPIPCCLSTKGGLIGHPRDRSGTSRVRP